MNILEFTRTINNPSKLQRDLMAEETAGQYFSFINIKGNKIFAHYTQNLNQSQIDAVSALVGAFSDISVYDTIYNYLGQQVDPFVVELLRRVRAENIEMGITQSGKTYEVLAFMETSVIAPNRTRAVSLMSSLTTSSLTVTVELLNYYLDNPELYSDLSPFITQARLESIRDEIIDYLS